MDQSKQLSLGQYRTIDLTIFALLTCGLELLNMLAVNVWFTSQLYVVSLFLPICLIVLMRWGAFAAIHAALAGIVYCMTNGGTLVNYATYVIGNLFILLTLVLFRLVGKKKLISKWYFVPILSVFAFAATELGRTLMSTLCTGKWIDFGAILVKFAATDSLSLMLCVVILLVARRQNGMFEDQKAYLIRIQNERKEAEKPAPPIDKDQLDQLNEIRGGK